MTKIVNLKDAITLDDLQACNDTAGLGELFRKLGYAVDAAPALLNKAEFAADDQAAIDRIVRVAHCDDTLQVILVRGKPERSAPRLAPRLRSITEQLVARGKPLFLIFTDTYPFARLTFVNPIWLDVDTARPRLQLRKLTIDICQPTPFDLSVLRRCAARGQSAPEVYRLQCDAFDPDRIADEFYRDYAAFSIELEDRIRALNKSVPAFRKQALLRSFTQRLLRSVIFVYWLEKKRWLDGDANWLTTWYRRIVSEQGQPYFAAFLEKLFFETLNLRRANDDAAWGRVPYIGVDLFKRDYPPFLELPNDLFSPHDRAAILGFLNRQTWTIEQNSPDEQNVAVGIDLIGKTLERWLIGDEGLTPDAVMRYTVRAALVNYLRDDTRIDATLLREQFERAPRQMLTTAQRDTLAKSLRDIRWLDPAVRGGRALMLALQELAMVAQNCQPGKSAAEWKREWLSHCLYGVDTDREAVETTKWLLWSSLLLDSAPENFEPLPYLDDHLVRGNLLIETLGGQPILPSEADVAARAHAQIGLEISETEKTAARLRVMKDQYADADPLARVELRREMQQIENQIVLTYLRERQAALEQRMKALLRKGRQVQWKDAQEKRQLEMLQANLLRLSELMQDLLKGELPPPFLYRLHWSDVLKEKNGFDVVLGNVLQAQAHLSREQRLALQYEYPTLYDARADSAIYFFARGLELTRVNGTLVLIGSNQVLRGRHIQALGLANTAMQAILLPDAPADEIDWAAVMVQKKKPAAEQTLSVYALARAEWARRHDLAAYPAQSVAQTELIPPRPTDIRADDEDSAQTQVSR